MNVSDLVARVSDARTVKQSRQIIQQRLFAVRTAIGTERCITLTSGFRITDGFGYDWSNESPYRLHRSFHSILAPFEKRLLQTIVREEGSINSWITFRLQGEADP